SESSTARFSRVEGLFFSTHVGSDCGMNQALQITGGGFTKVAVLIDVTNSVRRDFLLGISRYARRNGHWQLRVGSREDTGLVRDVKSWGANGVIAPICDVKTGRALVDAGLPTVATCLPLRARANDSSLAKLSRVSFDAGPIVAKLATEHFLERKFRNFAFVGF